jgi:triosephosphate isomerase
MMLLYHCEDRKLNSSSRTKNKKTERKKKKKKVCVCVNEQMEQTEQMRQMLTPFLMR